MTSTFRRKFKNPVPPRPPPLKSRLRLEDTNKNIWVKCLDYYEYLKNKQEKSARDLEIYQMFHFTDWQFEPEQWFIWFKELPEEGDIVSFKESDLQVKVDNIYRVYQSKRALIN